MLQYNTIQYKTYNAPYVTKMLFVGVLGSQCTYFSSQLTVRESNSVYS